MALVNHAKREINAKIVYYGPEGGGKSTSLRYIHDRIRPALRGELKTLPSSGSTLLFFDFSPFEQQLYGGYRVRIHLYTLTGRVANPAAWKMTLKGADGLVVVTDVSEEGLSSARQSLVRLRGYLNSYGMGLDDMPLVLQLNKAEGWQGGKTEISRSLGLAGCSVRTTSALSGDGVLDALATLSRQVMGRVSEHEHLPQENGPSNQGPSTPEPGRMMDNGDAHDAPGGRGSVREDPLDEAPSTTVLSPQPVITVGVGRDGVRVDGDTILIPIDTSVNGISQRFTVSVKVAAG